MFSQHKKSISAYMLFSRRFVPLFIISCFYEKFGICLIDVLYSKDAVNSLIAYQVNKLV